MRTLVVFCHPCGESFAAHLRDRVIEVLGADTRLIDLYADDSTVTEGRTDLEWAEALVFVYPTWWSSLPAPLIGWIEAMLDDRRAFGGVSRIIAITTHGSGRVINTLEGGVGRKMLKGGLKSVAAPGCRAEFLALYGVDRASDDRRRRFADELGRRLNRALR
jgi:NAD(P)H dehydrogenase (quinone)